jgi:hypothetical protein
MHRPVRVRVRFYAGGRADEVPRSVEVGGEEEPVEPIASFLEERGGTTVTRFRVRTRDGTVLDLVGPPDESRWLLESPRRM